MSKDSFIFYFHWGRSIHQLKPEEQLEVFNAIVQLAETGKTGKLSPVAHAAIAFVKPMIEKDRRKYERVCARNRTNATAKDEDDDESIIDEDERDYLAEDDEAKDVETHMNGKGHLSDDEDVKQTSFEQTNSNETKQEAACNENTDKASSKTSTKPKTAKTMPETGQKAGTKESEQPEILIFNDDDDHSGGGSPSSPRAPLTGITLNHSSEKKPPKVAASGKTFTQSLPLGRDNDNEYDNDNDYETSKRNGSLSAPKGYERFKFNFMEPPFRSAFMEWLAYKRERREKYTTQRTLLACYNQLVQLSGGDPAVARKVVEQSEANNWAGLFKLRKDNSYGNENASNTLGARQAVRAGEDAFGRVMQRISSRQGAGAGAPNVFAGGAAAAMP